MRKLSFLFLFFFVISVSINFAQEKQKKSEAKDEVKKETVETKDQVKADANSEAVKVNNKTCIVSGEEIEDSDVTYTHNGKTYNLCCEKCLKKVQADPEKYISRYESKQKKSESTQ